MDLIVKRVVSMFLHAFEYDLVEKSILSHLLQGNIFEEDKFTIIKVEASRFEIRSSRSSFTSVSIIDNFSLFHWHSYALRMHVLVCL